MDIIIKLGISIDDIYIGYNEKNEYFLRDDDNIFFYDFTIISKKIIIEYNGVAFHPKTENSKWSNPFNSISAYDAYNKQSIKKKLAEDSGFSILEIWSDEDGNIDKCLDFIKNNI
jgi:very-short-patch-repair endonuclease